MLLVGKLQDKVLETPISLQSLYSSISLYFTLQHPAFLFSKAELGSQLSKREGKVSLS